MFLCVYACMYVLIQLELELELEKRKGILLTFLLLILLIPCLHIYIYVCVCVCVCVCSLPPNIDGFFIIIGNKQKTFVCVCSHFLSLYYTNKYICIIYVCMY